MLAKALALLACPPWRGAAGWLDTSANCESIDVAYRITEWPELLDESWHTAQALRAMSVMTVRPVTVRWLHLRTGWTAAHTLDFIRVLEDAGCVEHVTVRAPHPLVSG